MDRKQDVQRPPSFHWTRRPAISSESPDPSSFQGPPVYPKPPQVRAELEKVIQNIVMFKHLTGTPRNIVIDAMRACQFPSGHIVIQEGAMDGEDMFIIMEGQLDVFYGTENVTTIGKGRCFGEVALMFNCPRTATIVSTTPVVLYALGRPIFRSILIDQSIKERARYEEFLKKVPLLQQMSAHEISRFADALEPYSYPDGFIIMHEGQIEDNGKFYIVESGQVQCTKSCPETGKEITSVFLTEGQWFGEVALLSNRGRQATVRCVGPTRCLAIARSHFLSVIGPIEEILKRSMESYKTYQQLIQEQGMDEETLPGTA